MDTPRLLLTIAAGLSLALPLASSLWLKQRGRRLCEELRRRHPRLWEEWGRPKPGLIHSKQRSAFHRVLAERLYEQTRDSELVEAFAALHRHTTVVVIGAMLFAAPVAAAIWWYGPGG